MSNKSLLFIISAFVFFSLIAFSATREHSLKVISSTPSEITLEYSPRFTKFEKDDSGYTYNVKGALLPEESELPYLYVQSVSVGVPSFDNSVEILSVDYSTINGDIKKPYEEINRNFSFDKWVTKHSSGISRGLQIENYFVYPLLYSESDNKILKLKKIVFRIKFGNTSRKFSTKKNVDNIPLNAVINSEIAKNWFLKKEKKKSLFNSVLAEGIWHRTNIGEEGIYKVDYNTLVSLGFNPETDDPRTIKIYNNGGISPSEKVTGERAKDLEENPILFFGDSDGKLNEGDYFVFYGHGNDFFYYDTTLFAVSHYHNQFSKSNYYFLTWGGTNGKRIQNEASLNTSDFSLQQKTSAFVHHEKDNFNPLKSGRLFLGEEFNSINRTYTFTNDLPDRVSEEPIFYKFGLTILSSDGLTATFYENDTELYSRFCYGYGSAHYTAGKYYTNEFSYSGELPENKSKLKAAFQINTSSQKGAIDYYTITYKRKLTVNNGLLVFFSENATNVTKYEIENSHGNEVYVLDVTNHKNIKRRNTIEENGSVYFIADEHYRGSKYVAFTLDMLSNAPKFESVENQNLHGTNFNAELIVIANRKFSESAQRFAEYKINESPEHISTAVFYTDEIYNEFSYGMENNPIAIRDFVMYAYDNWDIRPKYVLLFGKGTYDYYDAENFHANFVPTYQSKDRTLYEIDTYMTDDFFGWVEGDDNLMDLGVGRLPVKTEEEAEAVVDKIIDYENNSDFSNWRRLAVLVADDGWTTSRDDGNEHTSYSEQLADVIPDYFDKEKIYLVLYPTEITGAGRRKPLVNRAIIDAINNGALIMNYQGHGNPDVWAHEQVFVKDVTIPQLTNKNLPFITVAACDFGRSDDPARICGAEMLLLKQNGGAIGSFASNRLVFSPSNAVLNENFYEALLLSRDSNGFPSTLGNAFLAAKISFPIVNSYKYSLLGDPSLRLKIPFLHASIDSVNGNPLNDNVIIKALSDVKIDGSLSENSFSGESVITVYDSKRYVTITEPGWHNMQIEFNGAVLYRGRASVEDGKFGAQFIVPKDISFENRNGKIVAYVFNDERDGVGFSEKIIIDGIENRENDGAGPEIEIAFDDFGSNGNLVNDNFTLLAKLSDETGINTSTAGLGHTLEGIIDENLENPIDFTNSFVGDLDAGGKAGEIQYNFYNFEPGEHTIKIKAWDVFNNSSEKETDFTVVQGDGLVVRNIVNFPNPFADNTYFTFQHNLGEPVDVEIAIYTVYGRKIKEIKEYGIMDRFVKIFWDGFDEDGDKLSNGTYLYKLIVKSQSGKYYKSFTGKLAVIR